MCLEFWKLNLCDITKGTATENHTNFYQVEQNIRTDVSVSLSSMSPGLCAHVHKQRVKSELPLMQRRRLMKSFTVKNQDFLCMKTNPKVTESSSTSKPVSTVKHFTVRKMEPAEAAAVSENQISSSRGSVTDARRQQFDAKHFQSGAFQGLQRSGRCSSLSLSFLFTSYSRCWMDE